MAGYYVVEQGDCLAKIARISGFADYKSIWSRPENAAIRAERKDPNVLQPGDNIFIPDKELRTEQRATGASHTFVLSKQPTFIEIAVQLDTEPIAGVAYTLQIGDVILSGTTDLDGILRQQVDVSVAQGSLHIDSPPIDWELELGELNPITEISGLQQRLNNLGFICEAADGIIGPRTRSALRMFQKRHDLLATGKPDATTIRKLHSEHDAGS